MDADPGTPEGDELELLVTLVELYEETNYPVPQPIQAFKEDSFMESQESIKEKIEEMVRRIVDRFHPQKIILFGSLARGNAQRDSDADILVVMPVKGSKRKQATEIDVSLIGLDLPTDVIVVTPEELEKNRDRIGTIIYPAIREGKVLYERTA